jgi:membrane-bound lytic murein transglycosylase B
MKFRLLAIAALTVASVSCSFADNEVPLDVSRPDVSAFIDEMVRDHGFDRDSLSATLADARIKPSIIEKISTPAEKRLTWSEYRKIFLTKERINAGTSFWRDHKDMLERIERESGVPVAMIVGIIGVETYYGRITGKDRVLDALATLAFEYPRRAKFFRSELSHFLILAREEELDATIPLGSYAGAMGRPQFMPSSFRAYAIDATGDGKRDIWNDWADVAGSVANYFSEHGWKTGEEVAAQATLGHTWAGPRPEPRNKLSASETVDTLSQKGVMFTTDQSPDSQGELLTYEVDGGLEHWVGFHNFFVITRYNRSAMYALAAYQLGEAIAGKVSADAG